MPTFSIKQFLFVIFSTTASLLLAQTAAIDGKILANGKDAIEYANIGLFSKSDSNLIKAELSNESGEFKFSSLASGEYFIKITSLGIADKLVDKVVLQQGESLQLGIINVEQSAISLKETTVTAKRSLIEVKPDKTIFNVEGTINSIGSDAISLLRKAPGIVVDNNDNINVLGRSGVLIYVDGKRLPLSGQDLSNYLQSLTADQIDRFEIISNPGANYEAQGNAGIIDIRLKRDKNFGTNATLNASYTQGVYPGYNLSTAANFRNRYLNLYINLGTGENDGFGLMDFRSFQNGLFLKEIDDSQTIRKQNNARIGVDFFITKNQTLGLLVSANKSSRLTTQKNTIELAKQLTPEITDSSLIANTDIESPRIDQTYNINYQYKITKDQNLNIDLDYGQYNSKNDRLQINRYFKPETQSPLSEVFTSFSTPIDISIKSAKFDYTHQIFGGNFSLGSKISSVHSDNQFLLYDGEGEEKVINKTKSNLFDYQEDVLAGYLNYSKEINKKLGFSAGLRVENTHTKGNLTAFLPELQEPPVLQDYISWFPSAGITYGVDDNNSLAFNYGRRINRPDYNVLNPFNNQFSQLSFEKGNPKLKPEIVNNLEVNYNFMQMYNFKIGYSKTIDQITRLIGPDDSDPRATYINWDNLANQTIWSFSASLPFQILPFWTAYINASGSHIDNQADYGNGAVVNLQAFSYEIFQQHNFKLPYGFNAEISSNYSGPGIWGGVFEYDSSWNLDIGLQKRFFNEKLNIKLSGTDLFYSSYWRGGSNFNGLESRGSGKHDSRRIGISLSYKFGNEKVQTRKRETGLSEEQQRANGG